jgi:hypothetical protein
MHLRERKLSQRNVNDPQTPLTQRKIFANSPALNTRLRLNLHLEPNRKLSIEGAMTKGGGGPWGTGIGR